jgi:uracil-DNA glycosylase family 4
VLEKALECVSCPLETIGGGFSTPEGTGSIPMLLVGESLGYNEMLQGLPFRPDAVAGSLLHRIIAKAGVPRSSVALWNLIGCRPPADKLDGTWYQYSAVNHCRVHFDKVIEKYKPKVILALGALPFKHLTGLEGFKLNVSNCRGYVFRSTRYPDTLVIPTYHPSYVRRGNLNLMGVLLNDFVKAKALAQGKLVGGKDYILDPLNTPLKYYTKPDVSDALAFLDYVKNNPETLISYDIETEKSAGEEEDEIEEYGQTITQIQFSINMASGIAFPYIEPFINISKQLLASSNPKAGHNIWDFDNPILRNHGFVINGRVDDTMWMQHHMQADIPIGLQYTASFYGFPFAWKHMSGSNFEFYGIADVTSVQYIMEQLPKKLKERGMWEGYDKYVYGLKPVLVDIQDRGIPINVEKQQAFGLEIEAFDDKGVLVGGRKKELLEEIKDKVPDDFEKLNKIDGYKREPKEVRQARIDYMLEIGNSSVDVPEDYVFEKTGFVLKEFRLSDNVKVDETETMLRGMGVVFVDTVDKIEKRWVKLLDFNPNSVDQISDVIKLNGHEELAKKLTVKIGKSYEGEEDKKNLSTSKALLKKLSEKTGNDIYKRIIEFKELGKMKGTYIDGYKVKPKTCKNCSGVGIEPSPMIFGDITKSETMVNIINVQCMDCKGTGYEKIGRIHTTYTYRPSSGQLSSRSPNVQNYPVHSTLAEKFKECIEAPEGRILVSIDYRGFHNKMMGFLAQDPVYLRVASIDSHSFVTGHVVGYEGMDKCLELNDVELEKFLVEIKKKYKKLRDDQIKHVVHGINFGLSEQGCYKRYMEDFNPSAEEVLRGKRKTPNAEILGKLIEQAGMKKVKGVYNIVRGLFPKLFEWQAKTIVEADTKGFIQTPFGARRWFFAASEIKYDRFGNPIKVSKGEQAEQALAFPVSNSAHYHMRESMLLLNEAGLDKKFRLINMIHDSLVFEPLEVELSECLERVKEIMERKSKILKNAIMPEGFWCAADAKMGKSMRGDVI